MKERVDKPRTPVVPAPTDRANNGDLLRDGNMLAGASFTADRFAPETRRDLFHSKDTVLFHSKDTVTARWGAPRTWSGSGTKLSFAPGSK